MGPRSARSPRCCSGRRRSSSGPHSGSAPLGYSSPCAERCRRRLSAPPPRRSAGMRAPNPRLPVPVFLERALPYAAANSLLSQSRQGVGLVADPVVIVVLLVNSRGIVAVLFNCPPIKTATGRESAVRFGTPLFDERRFAVGQAIRSCRLPVPPS